MAILKTIDTKNLPYMEHIVNQDINEGDLLVVHWRSVTKVVTVDKIKTSETDGLEVIFDKKRNHFFNLSAYRKNESFVVDLYRINF